MLVPVKDMAGCNASGITPAAVAGASTDTPRAGAVCSTSWPGCHTPAAASPDTRAGNSPSGTASTTSSLRLITSGISRIGTPGSIASARSRLAWDTAEMPTMAWPAPAIVSAKRDTSHRWRSGEVPA